MNFTVYCMGDLPIFRDVLNAVAMVFNSSLFNPSLGAGLVVVGMLLSLILFAFPALMGKPLSPFPLIFIFILYFGGIVPKETLQIQDMSTGAVTSVANIPLIVAAPAAIAAAIAKGITDNIETAFTSPSQGTYLSLGAEGFVNPLKILLSFRNPSIPAKAAPFLTASIENFMRDCAVNASNFNVQTLRKSNDAIAYLTTLNVSGLTLYFNSAKALGTLITCTDSITNIQADMATLVAIPSTLDKSINLSTPTAAASPGGTQSMQTAYNAVTSMILTNSQNAQQFMGNLIANYPIGEGIKCANAGTAAELTSCQAEMTVAVGIEQANIDAAANASIFAKTAMPLANILLVLFYAFSPIVLGVALMSAAHGMKILAGFLMFGAWTQSIMPTAAILNFLIQEQVQYEMAKLGSNGITLENMSQFYNSVSLKVGLASELLADAPAITFALLSGSMYALSNLSGKFTHDRVDEKNLAPDASTTGALVSKGNLVAQGTTMAATSSYGGYGADVIGNNENKAMGSADLSGMLSQSVDKSEAAVKAAGIKTDQAIAHVAQQAKANNKGHEFAQMINSTTSSEYKEAAANAVSNTLTDEEVKSMSKTDQELLSAGLSLKIAGNGVASEKTFGMMKQQGLAHKVADSKSFKEESSRAHSESSQRSFGEGLKTANSTVLTKSDSKAISSSVDESQRAEDALKRSQSMSNAVGTNVKQDMGVLGAQAIIGYGSEEGGEEAILGSLSKDERDAYDKEKKMNDQLNVRNGVGSNPSARMAASLKSLATVNPEKFLNVLQGAGLAGNGSRQYNQAGSDIAGRNANVNSEAAQIPKQSLSGTSAAAGKAEANHGSAGANTALVRGFTSTANAIIEKSIKEQGHLSTPEMNAAHLKAEMDGAHAFIDKATQLNFVNDHGDIAGMANIAEAAKQWGDFESDHPVAAAAVMMTPLGGVMRGAKLVEKAGAALTAAKSVGPLVEETSVALTAALKAKEFAYNSYRVKYGATIATAQAAVHDQK